MKRTRTLVISGNDEFTDGLVEWLTRGGQVQVVGRAHTGAQGLERLQSLRADLVLVDATLADTNGFELARRIKSRARAPLVVLLSFHDSQTARLEALAAGADAFLPTSETADRLIPLIGDLLRRRKLINDPEMVSGIPSMRGKPTDAAD